ncbi:hypothetical protein B9Z55_026405 [Caenorhabditis nigoni]|uniref:Uncharacterized protein n=1 Tax=Caenorhabditis nigoni TaxID=1611254 RepID=A0A2G5T2M4_9PELO|nr:hypothetical protein B9Z55_026405 [Caenorhabditis nigoni]
MSLIWKIAFAVAVVLTVQCIDERHDPVMRQAIRPVQKVSDSPLPKKDEYQLKIMMVLGTIYCNGERAAGVQPFFQDPWSPDLPAVYTRTDKIGFYRLETTNKFDRESVVWFTVRHQCPMPDVRPAAHCNTPYYWTEIPIDYPDKNSHVTFNFDLADKGNYTRAHCLF